MDDRTGTAPPRQPPGAEAGPQRPWPAWRGLTDDEWLAQWRARGGRPHWWAHGKGPLRRSREGRLVGGVMTGLSERTGCDVTLLRVVAVCFGLVVVGPYVLAWLLLPMKGETTPIATAAVTDRRGIGLASALATALIALFVVASFLGAGWLGSVAWSIVICACGVVLIWRNAPEDEQAMLRRLTEPLLGLAERDRRLWRLTLAAVLLVVGLVTLVPRTNDQVSLRPLAGAVLVLAAVTVTFGPWWLRILRSLGAERQARIRAEERADMAARVHDSVLQTLAMIQRRAEDPQRVISLARAQERELRSWLFDGRSPGSLDAGATTFGTGVRAIQQEVETDYGVAVEAVTVGDCGLDDDLAALLAATREATMNAAKWSGATVVALFAEVEDGAVSVFVRDRGQGFDPATVPGDRKGLAESVRARMARRGGTVAIRSTIGEGTEVSLSMPRPSADRQAGRP